MPTTADVEAWSEAYRQAWETMDSKAASALFTEDANYRSNIFEEPHSKHAGIEAYWSGVTEAQAEVKVRMGTPFVDGSRAVVEFWTTLLFGGDPTTIAGSLLLRFDDEGLCTDLREYWQILPERTEPPEGWGE